MTARDRTGFALAVSMFSALPVPVRLIGTDRLDRPASRAALRWLPVLGALLGALAGAVGALLLIRTGSPLLAAVVVVLALALGTAALHLDGLADTADGLGSRAPAPAALEIMHRGDVGPFGVVVICGVLLLEVSTLVALIEPGHPWHLVAAVVVAAVTGRLGALHAGLPGIAAAGGSSFGSLVTGSVSHRSAVAITLLAAVATGALAVASDHSPVRWLLAQAAVLLILWWCRRAVTGRLGGITGDVFGALIELGTALSLLALVLAG
ncbi:MAG: adenosylcobinamide-GDP ribazoletransferase [Pseudonocardiales bacterium]|jgi:adenosylcobinamide-GDP ribazoletransferase|nr:adenosylcobinamide-GDP ribazoletransferase [Pseudonocardiales bacterium]